MPLSACGGCDCTPVAGTALCSPVFGPVFTLPFDTAHGALTLTDDPTGLRRWDFDWSDLIPGLTGTVNVVNDLGIPLAARSRFDAGGAFILVGNTPLCYSVNVRVNQPVQIRRLNLIDYDGPGNELTHSVDPPFNSVSGNFGAGPTRCPAGQTGVRCRPQTDPQPDTGCVTSNANNQTGFIFWDAVRTRTVSWTTWHRNLLSTALPGIEVQSPIPDRQAVRLICADGTSPWVFADDGATLTPVQIASLRECD